VQQVDQRENHSHEATDMAAKDDFTLDDFRKSLEHVKKMGARKDLIRSTPVLSEMILESEDPESAFNRIQRIIDAMTEEERRDADGIDLNNRHRIAAESGTNFQEVERFLEQFRQMRMIVQTRTLWPPLLG
jgi:signal recognition particle GTPase